MTRFLLATRNEGKRRELETVLSDSGIRVVSLVDYPELADVEEDGATFSENARKKALHFFRLTGLPAVADDSGLEIAELGGRPGVYSSRLAGTDPERIGKVLAMLKGLEDQGRNLSRAARFVCAICACLGDSRMIEVQGTVEGTILKEPRGDRGFGYDPIFFHPPSGLSFAEMAPARKNEVSHRGIALAKLEARLAELEVTG